MGFKGVSGWHHRWVVAGQNQSVVYPREQNVYTLYPREQESHVVYPREQESYVVYPREQETYVVYPRKQETCDLIWTGWQLAEQVECGHFV